MSGILLYHTAITASYYEAVKSTVVWFPERIPKEIPELTLASQPDAPPRSSPIFTTILPLALLLMITSYPLI